MTRKGIYSAAGLAAVALVSQAWAQQMGPLPDIQKGDIAIHLQPIVTGMGAPDYANSPPGPGTLALLGLGLLAWRRIRA